MSEENNKLQGINKIQEIISKNINLFVGIALISIILGVGIGAVVFPQDASKEGVISNPANSIVLSESELKTKTLDYLNSNSVALFQAEFDFEITDFNSLSDNLYSIIVSANKDEESLGEANFYITPDGKTILLGTALNLDEDLPQPEVPETPVEAELQKSDKPKVELFIMSHCPYGTMMEKAALPVAELLGEKIDFEVKFVYYAMHGEVEVTEQTKQYCIQKEQNEKFNNYLSCFLKEGDTETCLVETEIDVDAMDTCVTATDEEFNVTKNLEDKASWLSGNYPLFDVYKGDNEKYSVGGSPTTIINGVNYTGGRTPAALLATVCNSFNEMPEECQTALSTDTPSAGFGYDTGNATAAECGP